MKIRIDPLDKLFSEYIRKRAIARTGGCERCKKQKTSWKELQCMHFHSRRKRSVRWDEDNAMGGCYGCHSYLDGNPIEKVEFFKDLLGGEKFDHLNIRVRNTYPKPDKEMIKIYLKQKIKELEERYIIVPNKRDRESNNRIVD